MKVAERSTSGEQDGNSAQSPESKVSCRSLAVFIAEEGYAQADGSSRWRLLPGGYAQNALRATRVLSVTGMFQQLQIE